MTLPPWECTTSRDQKLFIQWACETIDKENEEALRRGNTEGDAIMEKYLEENQRYWASDEGLAIKAAMRGDIEPLRKLNPRIKEWVNLPTPKTKRGRKKKPQGWKDDFVTSAALLVPQIRDILYRYYGKRNRSDRKPPSVVAIAAHYFSAEPYYSGEPPIRIKVEDVEKKLKVVFKT